MNNITTIFRTTLAIVVLLLVSINTQAQFATAATFSEEAFVASLTKKVSVDSNAKEEAGLDHYQQVFKEMDQSLNKQIEELTSFSIENTALSIISTDNAQDYHKEIFSETNIALNNQLETLTSFTKMDFSQTASTVSEK